MAKTIEENRQYHREYYNKNKEHLRELSKQSYQRNKLTKNKYQLEHREERLAYLINWRKENPNYMSSYMKERRRTQPEKVNEQTRKYQQRKRFTDINYRIKKNIRTRLYIAVKNGQKKGSAIKDLGCSIDELKIHLAKQFQEGMNWDNYGKWHIDHIVPLSKFDLTQRESYLIACHYSNLQPLWAEDNIRKSNRI